MTYEEELLLSDALDALIDRKNEADELHGEGHDERHALHCAEAPFAWTTMNDFYVSREAAGMKGGD